MRRETRGQKEDDKIKWGKLISFLIAIVLLGVAIAISMTQERTVAEMNYNKLKENVNTTLPTEEASLGLSKDINEVKEQNNLSNESVQGDNQEENDNEIDEIKNSLETNANTNSGSNVKENTKEENNKKENESTNSTKENTVKQETVPETQFIFPVEGEVIKEYAKDNLIYSETLEEWITHTGIDIKADKATVVKAVAGGTVKSIKNDPRYGLTVTIEHSNGYVSSYSSLLTAEFVKEGEKVEQGQTIGTVGNSAVFEVAEDSHLHFELFKDGGNINPEMYIK